ncbi:hypothetical protein H0H87_004986 [Tephrocybe sp. NHM501043]|nr:hypothetical protein H0H87_004986 [Tephrocybe sp. NHM501043]
MAIVQQMKLPGADDHHFKLSVTSCENGVKITLPAQFRGSICVEGCAMSHVKFSLKLQGRIEKGLIRINEMNVEDDDDEIYIHASSFIEIILADYGIYQAQPAIWYDQEKLNVGEKLF